MMTNQKSIVILMLVTMVGMTMAGSFKQCTECKAFFATVNKELGQNATIQELKTVMEGECAKLGTTAEQKDCDEFVVWALYELPSVETTYDYYGPAGMCSMLGICSIPCCNGAKSGTPQQIMLAATGNATEMMVTWVSNAGQAPTVKYNQVSPVGGAPYPTVVARGSSRTYTQGGWEGQINS